MKLQSDFSQESWFKFLTKEQQILVTTSFELLSQAEDNQHLDYSYLVFPMAKAYEGFLKKLLFENQIIPEAVYLGKKFRIGRSLNPDVYPEQRDQFWFFDDLSKMCGERLARQIWDTWLKCRNRVFHYFVQDPQLLNLEQAKACLFLMQDTMNQTINTINNYSKKI